MDGTGSHGEVILATITPEFRDGGNYLLCELVSGGRKWAFGIDWSDTALAMERCGRVLEGHREKARNVTRFVHKAARERPPGHG